jgi:hypothetical protein
VGERVLQYQLELGIPGLYGPSPAARAACTCQDAWWTTDTDRTGGVESSPECSFLGCAGRGVTLGRHGWRDPLDLGRILCLSLHTFPCGDTNTLHSQRGITGLSLGSHGELHGRSFYFRPIGNGRMYIRYGAKSGTDSTLCKQNRKGGEVYGHMGLILKCSEINEKMRHCRGRWERTISSRISGNRTRTTCLQILHEVIKHA